MQWLLYSLEECPNISTPPPTTSSTPYSNNYSTAHPSRPLNCNCIANCTNSFPSNILSLCKKLVRLLHNKKHPGCYTLSINASPNLMRSFMGSCSSLNQKQPKVIYSLKMYPSLLLRIKKRQRCR